MRIPFVAVALGVLGLLMARGSLLQAIPVSPSSPPTAVESPESARLVYLPMIFHAEAQAIRTAACLRMTERIYSQSNWLENPGSNEEASDRALRAVIGAIKQKDRATLLKLSDPTQSLDTKSFDEQATAYFQQLAVVESIEVPRAYVFDGLVVFFAKLRFNGQTFFAPFVFAYGNDGSLGFLPSRTERVTFLLVEDWFNSKWGPAATDNPAYCTDTEIKSANYHGALVPSPANVTNDWQSSELRLIGVPLDTAGEPGNLAGRVKSKFEELRSSLNSKSIDDFLKHLTPEGGNRLKEWFASANEAERNQYKKEIVDQRPFFLFDASPLVVVYTKSPSNVVQVMYFTISANNGLLWTNSSRITVTDQVFKKGSLHDAALLEKPFSNLLIK
jgi:hypothetical protein